MNENQPRRSGHDPIESFEEDRLGRSNFARLLARALVEYPEESSLVVALYGDWGSGKTSTLNLCFRALEDMRAEDERPLLVRFNPWWFSNTAELLAQFFERLGNDLEQEGRLGGIKEKLFSYRKLIAPAGSVIDLFVSGGAITAAAGFASAAAERSAAAREQGSQDVRALRDDIERMIESSGRRITVVIDDIDRLSAAEIRDVFKVVKATANFPNTRYLLAFDHSTVTGALSEVQGTNGDAYLEKIVQVPFRLPQPEQNQLWDIVRQGMKEIASAQEGISSQELAEAEASFEVYSYYGFGDFFTNMRQANRLLDTLRLVLPPIAGEVRLSDFLVLEALRLIVPRVYDRLLGSQELLLGSTPGAGLLMFGSSASQDRYREQNEATKAEVEAILDAAPEHLRPVVQQLMEGLFPRAYSALHGMGGYGPEFHHEWISQKRVCVPEFFRTATSWGLAPGMISSSEVEDLSRLSDPALLRARLLSYDDDPRPGVDLKTVMRRMGAWLGTLADEAALKTALKAVFGIEGHGTAYPTLHLLALDALKELPDSVSRKALILDWIEDDHVTPVLTDVIRTLGGEHGWYRDNRTLPEEYRTLSPRDFHEVLSAAVRDIEEQARSGSLLRNDLFNEYLYLWKYAAGDEAPREYLGSVIVTERGLPELLLAYVMRTNLAFEGWTKWRPEAGERPELRVQLLEDLRLVEEAEARAEELLGGRPEGLSDQDRILLQAFVNHYASDEEPSRGAS